MPTSAPGTSSSGAPRGPRRDRGYTLLELVVVVFIIGVVAALATLSLGGRGRGAELEQESRRLQRTLELAADEAVLRGRVLGIGFAADGYGYCVRKRGRWSALADDPQLRHHALPEGLRLEWEADDPPASADPSGCPRAVLLPSGEIEPFRVTLVDPVADARAVLEAGFDGTFDLTLP